MKIQIYRIKIVTRAVKVSGHAEWGAGYAIGGSRKFQKIYLLFRRKKIKGGLIKIKKRRFDLFLRTQLN